MGNAEKAWHPATSVVAALLLLGGCSDGARPAAISSPSPAIATAREPTAPEVTELLACASAKVGTILPADFLTLEHGGHDMDQRPLKAYFQCVFERDLGDDLIEDDAREGMRAFAYHTVTGTDPFAPEPTGGTS